MTYETALHPSGWSLMGVVATVVVLLAALAALVAYYTRKGRRPERGPPRTDYECGNAGSRLWHECRSCGRTRTDWEDEDRSRRTNG